VPYLQSRGVLPHEFNADKTAFLLDDALARSVAETIAQLRALDLDKPPGVAEAIDWARALALLGADAADGAAAHDTLGWALKNHDDLRRVEAELFSG